MFEVSPSNEAVLKAKGKLLCSYPGPAIEVPSHVANDPAFTIELANFLERMNVDVLDAAPHTVKAKSTVQEIRDTTHPRYVTQLLTGILRGMGQPADVTRICKRIADDVLWKDALLPWRRAPLWLLIRVALQTSLVEEKNNHREYKAFMVFLMSKVLRKAVNEGLDSDLLSWMNKKMSRRVFKLGDATPRAVMEAAQRVGEMTRKLLEDRWTLAQEEHASTLSPRYSLAGLDFEADTRLSLVNSRPYLLQVRSRASNTSSPAPFHPSPSICLQSLYDFNLKKLEEAFDKDRYLALADFECAVESEIDAWTQSRLHDELASKIIASWVEAYGTKASICYSGSPVDMSQMFLTLFELWVGLDKMAVAQCPLLKYYSPEVTENLFEPLLLRKASSMQRLGRIVQHLRLRHEECIKGRSVFKKPLSHESFEVQHYTQSPTLQSLHARIEDKGQGDRDAKVLELRKLNQRHETLMDEARSLDCTKTLDKRNHYVHKAKKCKKEREAKRLSIHVHEWPLPVDSLQAKHTVFELACPAVFAMWRDSTHYILHDLCIPHELRLDDDLVPHVQKQLTEYTVLESFVDNIRKKGKLQ